MKITFGLLGSLLASVALSQGGVVAGTNINTATGDTVISNSAGAAFSGGIAAAGYFNTGFDVAAAVATQNYAALVANFNTLSSNSIGSTTLDFGSNIAGYYSIPSASYGEPGALLGQTLYTFFGSASSLAASLAGGQIGLVQFAVTIGPDTPSPDSNDLNLNTGGTHTVLIGTTGGTTVVDLTSVNGTTPSNPSIRLVQVIPEPSTALLGAIGALGLLRRRR